MYAKMRQLSKERRLNTTGTTTHLRYPRLIKAGFTVLAMTLLGLVILLVGPVQATEAQAGLTIQ